MSKLEFLDGGLGGEVFVAGLRGVEGISVLYELELWLVMPTEAAGALDLDAVIGERGTLVIKPAEDAETGHPYQGIVREVAIVAAARGGALLRLVLVPELYKLTESRHSRVYTNKAVGAVIEDVLGRAGMSMSLRLEAEHPDEEHIVQYRESDYRFLARWMEREGIFYYFTHPDEGSEELIFSDTSSGAAEIGPVRYHPTAGGDVSAGEALSSFAARSSAQPQDVQVRDYDHLRPALAVEGAGSIEGLGGRVVVHGHRTFSPGDAARLAGIIAEAGAAARQRFVARGTVFGLRPGMVIDLQEHARLGGRYLITRVEHRASEQSDLLRLARVRLPRGYEAEIECIPADVPFRSPLALPWPRIHGYQLGQVDGPADNDYAQLDEHGRYLVKMFCDESDLAGSEVSTRIRMMQPHAGAPEGWHFPLRKGTEVVIQFLDGDPDRPVIAGAVPNAVTPSPVTKANATQNVLQTGGLTRLEVEDNDGHQYIWLHTPTEDTYLNLGYPELASHNITLHSDADCLYDIGTDQLIEVGGNLDEQVQSDVKETYHATQTSTIDGPQETTVDGAVSETYLSTQTTTVNGGARDELFQNGQTTLVLGARQETYNAAQMQQVFGSTTETYVGGWTRTVDGSTLELHNGTLTELVAGPSMEMCPTSVTETYGPTNAIWASLLWITPSVTRSTPSVIYINPLKIESGANKHELEPVINGWGWTDIGASGLKLESIGVLAGVTGVKIEGVGLAGALNGLVFEPGIFKLELTGIAFTTVGFKVNV